ncbi:saccharopine dehydrogenase family protein [Streptomyces litchfieldiae]|uniref:Saccharopine dehydrogenase NADP-binding domain-containing protein n=1 Tax=Streptomyces litchfieldiae TaxID=3075543 RepID=A0ABU2MZU9_9ACTN|nr:saccharopine dehydrogenase NADP-binding domain-containing protein [Streptomyces sp. DSM 44938]MDT0347041.1 saccharopine dehydrogenase NADP-binding domain-containing protein [Streptomyces sp. DSM 44938]
MRIAVYGATGFTAGLVMNELARRGVATVAIGRDIERVRAAGLPPGAEPRAAALDDPDRLAAALSGCDAVINCVTPFDLHGEPVVRAALAAGCHYVDTTGEQGYLRRLFATYAADAERAGVTVLPALTDDGVPGDLIAHLVAGELGGEVAELTIADLRLPGSASRGTARTAVRHAEELRNGGLTWADGRWHGPGRPVRRTEVAGRPVVKFALPGVVTVPRHVRAGHIEGVIAAEVAEAFTSITGEWADSLPSGPDAGQRAAGRWRMAAHATAADGREAHGAVWGTDVYGTTATIAVEGVHRLLTDGAKPGVLAPAEAFAPVSFLDALGGAGVRWEVTTGAR